MLKHVDDVEAFENYITAEEIKRIYNIMKEGVSFINTLNLSITEFKLILNAKLTKRYLNTTLNLKVNFINTMHNHIIPEYAVCAISIGSDDIFTPILLKHNLQKCFTLENGLWNIQELPKLSDVEKKIIILSSRGYTISELSTILMKSTDTIKSYRRSLFEKLNAKNIVQAISIAQNYQLI